tara:strand:+ start:2456 stop:3088 length:633 start_codon:yes stop_codon:yes gene_type:complete
VNTSEHPIFLKSIDYIKTQLGITGLDFVQQSVLERMIHSSGDFSFQGLLKFSPTACNQAMEALKKGVQIFTDTQMAKAAVSPMAKRTFNSNVQCILDMAPHSIDSSSTTRSAIGMRNIWLDLEKRGQFVNAPIVVIGSAPTALMALLDLIDKGSPIPSLIIGMPVGFIGVSESKNRLLNSKYPHIVLEGSKGGASLASAAINALLKAAHN